MKKVREKNLEFLSSYGAKEKALLQERLELTGRGAGSHRIPLGLEELQEKQALEKNTKALEKLREEFGRISGEKHGRESSILSQERNLQNLRFEQKNKIQELRETDLGNVSLMAFTKFIGQTGKTIFNPKTGQFAKGRERQETILKLAPGQTIQDPHSEVPTFYRKMEDEAGTILTAKGVQNKDGNFVAPPLFDPKHTDKKKPIPGGVDGVNWLDGTGLGGVGYSRWNKYKKEKR